MGALSTCRRVDKWPGDVPVIVQGVGSAAGLALDTFTWPGTACMPRAGKGSGRQGHAPMRTVQRGELTFVCMCVFVCAWQPLEAKPHGDSVEGLLRTGSPNWGDVRSPSVVLPPLDKPLKGGEVVWGLVVGLGPGPYVHGPVRCGWMPRRSCRSCWYSRWWRGGGGGGTCLIYMGVPVHAACTSGDTW